MRQIQPSHNLNPFSIAHLLDLYTTLDRAKIKQCFQNFIIEEGHTPKEIPHYVFSIFSKTCKRIISMISCIVGFTSNEFVDEIIVDFLFIFTLGQPLLLCMIIPSSFQTKCMKNSLDFPQKKSSNTLQYCFVCSYIIKQTISQSRFIKQIPGEKKDHSSARHPWSRSITQHSH